MMRISSLTFAALTVVATTSQAQSTSRLGHVEEPRRIEASVGIDRASDPYYEGTVGTVYSTALAVRWTGSSSAGIRAAVRGIQRDVGYTQRYDGANYDSVQKRDRVLMLTVDTDFTIHVWRDLTLVPSTGAGFSPYAHGRESTVRVRSTQDVTPYEYGNYSKSDVGFIWTLGLALRYRHLVIEKQAIGLLGAESAVQHGREYYPWTIGYRF